MGGVRLIPDAQPNADISGRAAGIASLVPAKVQMGDTAHLALACLLQESFPETLVRESPVCSGDLLGVFGAPGMRTFAAPELPPFPVSHAIIIWDLNQSRFVLEMMET